MKLIHKRISGSLVRLTSAGVALATLALVATLASAPSSQAAYHTECLPQQSGNNASQTSQKLTINEENGVRILRIPENGKYVCLHKSNPGGSGSSTWKRDAFTIDGQEAVRVEWNNERVSFIYARFLDDNIHTGDRASAVVQIAGGARWQAIIVDDELAPRETFAPLESVQGTVPVLYHPGEFTEPEPEWIPTEVMSNYNGPRLVDADRPNNWKNPSPICAVYGDKRVIKGTDTPCPANLPEGEWPNQILPDVPPVHSGNAVHGSILSDRTEYYTAVREVTGWDYLKLSADLCADIDANGYHANGWRWAGKDNDGAKTGGLCRVARYTQQEVDQEPWKAEYQWDYGYWRTPCDDPSQSEGVFAPGGFLHEQREAFAIGVTCRSLRITDNDPRATNYTIVHKLGGAPNRQAAREHWRNDISRVNRHNNRVREYFKNYIPPTNVLWNEWLQRSTTHQNQRDQYFKTYNEYLDQQTMFVACYPRDPEKDCELRFPQ